MIAEAALSRQSKPGLNRATPMLLQRKCACGQHTGNGGKCEACKKKREGALQRAAVNTDSVNEVPAIVHDVLRSPGQPLDAATRAFMEPRFGQDFNPVNAYPDSAKTLQFNLFVSQPEDASEREAERAAKNAISPPMGQEHSLISNYDFSHVRIHTDHKATESARAVNALAYTLGNHIVFGEGHYQPQTHHGRQLLAHELAHIVQHDQNPTMVGVYRRLDPKLCSSNAMCTMPDKVGTGTPSFWHLTLAVDKEGEGAEQLTTGNVGHTWVKLGNNANTRYSYGFWPQAGLDPQNPLKSVPGCVHHPDTAHAPPNATDYLVIDYALTKANFDNALSHAQAICAARPAYNLTSYNCTTFAIDVAKAAGVTPPSSSTLSVHNPSDLFEGIKKEQETRLNKRIHSEILKGNWRFGW